MLMFLPSCAYRSTDIGFTEDNESAVSDVNIVIQIPASLSPVFAYNMEQIVSNVSDVRFGENFGIHSFPTREQEVYYTLRRVYRPLNIPYGYELDEINMQYKHSLSQIFANEAEDYVAFIWNRAITREDAWTLSFGRGATAEYIVERNGITYGVTEWLGADRVSFGGYGIDWGQHGNVFTVSASPGVTLEEAFVFAFAQQYTSWELDGNALSVSIQDTGIVAIFDETGSPIVRVDDTLYRQGHGDMHMHGGGGSPDMVRVGYRYLIDADLNRYQYVLEPGYYSFFTALPGDDFEVLLRGFSNAQVVAEFNHTKSMTEETFNYVNFNITPGLYDYGFYWGYEPNVEVFFDYPMVEPLPPVIITSPSLFQPDLTGSNPYTFQAIGEQPIHWHIESGSLPFGIHLHPNGTLSGGLINVYISDSLYTFTVRASNHEGSAVRTFTLVVKSDLFPPFD
jgi:putative flippase GtrA